MKIADDRSVIDEHRVVVAVSDARLRGGTGHVRVAVCAVISRDLRIIGVLGDVVVRERDRRVDRRAQYAVRRARATSDVLGNRVEVELVCARAKLGNVDSTERRTGSAVLYDEGVLDVEARAAKGERATI